MCIYDSGRFGQRGESYRVAKRGVLGNAMDGLGWTTSGWLFIAKCRFVAKTCPTAIVHL